MKSFISLLIIALLAGTWPADAQDAPKSRGNTFNPDIGVNGLFLYRNSSRGNAAGADQNGFGVQEAELQFAADVDPYLRAVANFGVERDPTTGEWEFDTEEIYGETIGLSLVTVRFGLFNALVVKHNLLHTHAYPFLDAPVINTELFGEEPLRESGLSVSALIPTDWFMELTLQVLNGDSPELFASPTPNDNAGLAYLDTLFDLSDTLTLQAGASYLTGQNLADATLGTTGNTRVVGGELAVKWKPIGVESIRTLKWATQFLAGEKTAGETPNDKKQGIASWVQWQFEQRWWLQVRTEYMDEFSGGDLAVTRKKNTALVAFTPSEFSAIRGQFDQLDDGGESPERRLMVQFNWSIGAHPAHQY
ncbi:MAG TPA: hypothetical protein VFV50_18945 [Bdellovibrionales bacterium]|nr:hypothetical protein [Bdellovibrionales bacterium]